jgi:hypothetical protein
MKNLEKYDYKACPWRFSGHYTVHTANCIKGDCLAWDKDIGCKLIERGKDDKV